MVEVRYRGGLGEMLFQYCLGRALAESWGHHLAASPIWGFPNTGEVVEGKKFLSPVVKWSGITARSWATGEEIAPGQLLRTTEGRLILDGWFQSFELLRERADDIRGRWLLPDVELAARPRDELALSLRFGASTMWLHSPEQHLISEAPPKYTKPDESEAMALLSHVGPGKLHVVTNRPGDPTVAALRQAGAQVFSEGDRENLRFLRSFRRIAIGGTAYDWWAAFLSRAQKVYPLWGDGDIRQRRRDFTERGPAAIPVPEKEYLLHWSS